MCRQWISYALLALLSMSGTSLAADTIYRTVDDQGNVMFTDDPRLGGEAMDLKPVTVVPSSGTAGQSLSSLSSSRLSGDNAGSRYSDFRIASPGGGQTLPVGQAGSVEVHLAIEPALRRGHRVQLLVDGQSRQSPRRGSTFVLQDLERGAHTLSAELLDAGGQVLERTSPVTLYVKRASVNLPQNPNRPPDRPASPVSGISGAPSIPGAGASNP